MEQNGGQPATNPTEPTAPPTDPRTRNIISNIPPTPEPQRICRDFVWGICLLNEHCRYRHELDYDSMRSILKFCHDYQNRTGCLRPDCTYLHTSREEQNAFLLTGQIPRVLAERYASMAMTIPQVAAPHPVPAIQPVEAEPTSGINNLNEYMAQPPPPPPPLPNSSGAPLPPATMPLSILQGGIPTMMPGQMTPAMPGPMTLSMTGVIPPVNTPMIQSMPQMSGMMPPIQRPLDTLSTMPIQSHMPAVMNVPRVAPLPTILAPPPPPPPPPTFTTAPTLLTGPTYSVPPPVHHTTPVLYPPNAGLPSQNLPIPVMYDPSRPPPPIPGGSQARTLKRPSNEPEAGPSKERKTDTTNDGFCENCVQRELRSQLFQEEVDKLQRENDYQRLLYENSLEKFNKGRRLLRSLLSPEMYRLIENLFESNEPISSTSSDLFTPSSSLFNSLQTDHSNDSREMLLELVDFVFSSSTNHEHIPPVESMPRRDTIDSDVVASILELIRNSGSSTENRVTAVDPLNTNGLNRFPNGQLENSSSQGERSRYPSSIGAMSSLPSTSAARYPAPLAAVTSQQPAPPPGPPPAPAPAPPPPSYMPYIPSVPPNRPYYQPYPGVSNTMTYPAPMQQTPRASTSTSPAAPPTSSGQSFSQQYMARMPHQHQ